jgi:hypothetical protein
MSPDVVKEKILSLTAAEAQQERIVNSLLHFMIDLDSKGFEETLNEYIRDQGIEDTISNLIFPFLHKIGILWVTDRIKVAQEHLVSNVIRQKFILGIENATHTDTTKKTVVMFLPEGEHHELGLLYVHYLLKSRGVHVLYLGADVPLEDLEFVCRMKQPDYAYSHLTSLPPKFNFEKYLTLMHTRMKTTQVVISGSVTHHYFRKLPSGISLKKTLPEVLEQLAGPFP